MGRKNLSEERTGEILDAFARCLVKYGLDTSLEQVADEAGMTRSIIRHYIGNREEVVNTLIERITKTYLRGLLEAEAKIPQDRMISETLNYLFRDQAESDIHEKLIFDIMMTAKDRYQDAKRVLIAMIDQLISMFTRDLMLAYPNAAEKRCRDVAYSILALSMSNDSFLWLGLDSGYASAARMSAEALIYGLA